MHGLYGLIQPENVPVIADVHIIPFKKSAVGQDVIGIFRCGSHKNVIDHDEIKVREDFIYPSSRMGKRVQCVEGVADHGLYWKRATGDEALNHLR